MNATNPTNGANPAKSVDLPQSVTPVVKPA